MNSAYESECRSWGIPPRESGIKETETRVQGSMKLLIHHRTQFSSSCITTVYSALEDFKAVPILARTGDE